MQFEQHIRHPLIFIDGCNIQLASQSSTYIHLQQQPPQTFAYFSLKNLQLLNLISNNGVNIGFSIINNSFHPTIRANVIKCKKSPIGALYLTSHSSLNVSSGWILHCSLLNCLPKLEVNSSNKCEEAMNELAVLRCSKK